MGFSVTIDGVPEFKSALQQMLANARGATESALEDASGIVREEIQANLRRREYPPVSPPGEPPAFRTGALLESVLARYDGEVDAGVFQARVYPSTVYARIQELGGWAGRDHRSHLPPRPYVEPAIEATAGQVEQAFTSAWSSAIGG